MLQGLEELLVRERTGVHRSHTECDYVFLPAWPLHSIHHIPEASSGEGCVGRESLLRLLAKALVELRSLHHVESDVGLMLFGPLWSIEKPPAWG